MPNEFLNVWLAWMGGPPSFRVFGRARCEKIWRVIDIFATRHRDRESPWPLCRGTCITWTSQIIAIGWDFAESLLQEQLRHPTSRQHPIRVGGGRIRDVERRLAAGERSLASAGEVMAHECGHTWQAIRLGPCYLTFVGAVTLFREGPYPWSYFENQASELGEFGGLVDGSVCQELMADLRT